ncbi:hypothetical protein RYX36_022805 [Vicia faba]
MGIMGSKQRHIIKAPSRVTVQEELIIEVLSMLNVKSMMRFKCVSKSCNSINSNSFFLKIHHDKSSRYPQIMVSSSDNIFVFPINILENPPINIFKKYFKYRLMERRHPYSVIGSCNGFICFNCSNHQPLENEFYLWNLTTIPFSENLNSFHLRF